MKKIIKRYLHADKDSNWEHGEELGLSDEALDKYRFWGYEVTVEVELDTETGKWKNLSFKDENNDNFIPKR